MEWTPISVFFAAKKAKSFSQLDTGIHSFGGGNWGASSCPNTLWACGFRVSCHPGHMAQIYWVPRCQSKGSLLFVCNILKLDCHQSYYYLAWPFACGAYGIKSCWSWGHKSQNMYLNLLSCSWIKWNFVMLIYVQVASVIRKVYARAVRNCPWVATLWTKYMLALERGSAPETELAAVSKITTSLVLSVWLTG